MLSLLLGFWFLDCLLKFHAIADLLSKALRAVDKHSDENDVDVGIWDIACAVPTVGALTKSVAKEQESDRDDEREQFVF